MSPVPPGFDKGFRWNIFAHAMKILENEMSEKLKGSGISPNVDLKVSVSSEVNQFTNRRQFRLLCEAGDTKLYASVDLHTKYVPLTEKKAEELCQALVIPLKTTFQGRLWAIQDELSQGSGI